MTDGIVFDALDELFAEPDYRGCAFMKASAESEPGSVEQLGNDAFRTWPGDLLLRLAKDAGVRDPEVVGRQLVLLYDGAVTSEIDHSPLRPSQLAKSIARSLFATIRPGSPFPHPRPWASLDSTSLPVRDGDRSTRGAPAGTAGKCV